MKENPQNENRWLGRVWSFMVIGYVTVHSSTYGFLFVYNINYVPFQDIASYLLQVRIFGVPLWVTLLDP